MYSIWSSGLCLVRLEKHHTNASPSHSFGRDTGALDYCSSFFVSLLTTLIKLVWSRWKHRLCQNMQCNLNLGGKMWKLISHWEICSWAFMKALPWHLVANRGTLCVTLCFPYTRNYKLLMDLLSFCSVDSGHLVHRPLRASGCGEHHLSGGILCAASLSFPGTSVCQALKNTLELAPESQADLPSLTSPEDPSLPSQ